MTTPILADASRISNGVTGGRKSRRVATLAVSCLSLLALTGVASDAKATTDNCPNAAVRQQQGSQSLPDCRAYEEVSPATKNGYGVGNNAGYPMVDVGVDPASDRASFVGFYPLPGTNNGSMQDMVSERGPGGWASSGMLPAPGPLQSGSGLPGLSMRPLGPTPDQRALVFWDHTVEPWGALRIRRVDGTYHTIVTAGFSPPAIPGRAAGPCYLNGADAGACPQQAWFAAMSDDGHRIVFASAQRIGPAVGLPGTSDLLYEWIDDGANAGAGTLQLVSRGNGPAPSAIDSASAAELGGSGSSNPDNRRYDGNGWLRHAISDGTDGHSRIFFQNPSPGSTPTTAGGPVYMREDGSRTVQLSAPEGANPPAGQARYLDASADGTKVFFWADGKLTDDAVAGGAIYRYDVDINGGGDLVFVGAAPPLTVPGGTSAPSGMASDDGSRLYYQKGPDVYVNTNGVDKLVLADTTIYPQAGYGFVGLKDGQCPSANVSRRDGRYFAFDGGGDHVYRYDAQASTLVPLGGLASATFQGTCGNVAGWDPSVHTRVMSDDGRYVFFETTSALVPEDSNGASDVYRWHDGEVSLISRGAGPSEPSSRRNSTFEGTDATGTNAFFITRDALVPQDGDEAADLYTARIDGGFAVVASPAGCEGDTCQGTRSPAPSFTRPGTTIASRSGEAVRFVLSNVTAAQRRALSRGRAIALDAKVSRAGRVSVTMRAKLGKRSRTVASASRSARRAGAVRLTLRLSKAARSQLSKSHRLRVAVSARFTGVPAARTLTLELRRAK
jgi:hypothetical protein